MNKTLYILGAEDPEMNAIENLLRQCGQQLTYALAREGKRVTPMSAYGQTFLSPEVGWEGMGIVTVECNAPDLPGCGTITAVDHHRPADPGYGKPPADYWEASSIGQVAALLDGNHGQDILTGPGRQAFMIVAAADHCLAAAYAGQCPGVDPTKLAEFRVEQLCSASRASNRKNARTPDEVRASIKSASEAILAAPQINLGGVMLADLRGAEIPDLPEAAMLLGIGYLAGGVSLREGDPPKIVIGGCGAGTIPGTAPVEAFLAAARTGQIASTPVHVDGQLKPYGDPVRGFAGAYNNL